MIKAPFRSPNILRVSQEYGSTTNNSWYVANGIATPFHNGIDICFGDGISYIDAKDTYGTECICPFESATVVKKTWDTPTSTKGNGVTIEAEVSPGLRYQVVFWHTGEIKVSLGDKLKLGDVICYIGNSGLVNPAPTKENPWAGSHCHLMLFKYVWTVDNRGSRWECVDFNNGVWGARNPRELFDFTQWYMGADTGLLHDAWVLPQWIKDLSGSDLVNYFKKIKFW